MSKFRYRYLAKGPTEEAQVDHQYRPKEYPHRPYVNRFDDGISILRFVEIDAPRQLCDLSEEINKRHSSPATYDPECNTSAERDPKTSRHKCVNRVSLPDLILGAIDQPAGFALENSLLAGYAMPAFAGHG